MQTTNPHHEHHAPGASSHLPALRIRDEPTRAMTFKVEIRRDQLERIECR
jgi:hypothetical protein